MRKAAFICLCLLSFACAIPVSAQEGGSHLAAERGRRSVALGVNSNSQIGYWMRGGTRTDVGVDLGLRALFASSSDDFAIDITPAMKRYLAQSGPLAPYGYFGVPLTYAWRRIDNTGAPDDTQDLSGVGGIAAFGLEWFPVRQVSLGGHVGLRGDYLNAGDGDSSFRFSTMSSGIRLHLYF